MDFNFSIITINIYIFTSYPASFILHITRNLVSGKCHEFSELSFSRSLVLRAYA